MVSSCEKLLVDRRLHLAFTWWTVTIGLFLYKSHNPWIFGRYSSYWFVLACLSLAGSAAATAIAARHTITTHHAVARLRGQSVWSRLPLMSLAAAIWAASLLTQFPRDERQIARLLYGEFLGATQPAGVVLEYLALALAVGAVLRWFTRSTRDFQNSRPKVSRALHVLTVIIVGLLLAEGAMRAINVWNPRTQEAPTKPSWLWHTRYVHLNSLGYRDREFAARADESAYRILLLGDSFTLGWGIRNPADRFGDLLEGTLNSTPALARRVAVYNAGVGAANSADELVSARLLLPRLRPHLLLLIYVFNDIEHLAEPAAHPALRPPSFSARFSFHRLLMLNSHFADQALLLWRAWTWSRPRAGAFFSQMYRDPELVRRHLDVLSQIQQTSESGGATFRVLPFQLHGDEQDRQRYSKFVRACQARGLPVWSMENVFDGRPYETLFVNHRDRHPNELANRLVGDYLSARVAELMAAQGTNTPGQQGGSI